MYLRILCVGAMPIHLNLEVSLEERWVGWITVENTSQSMYITGNVVDVHSKCTCGSVWSVVTPLPLSFFLLRLSPLHPSSNLPVSIVEGIDLKVVLLCRTTSKVAPRMFVLITVNCQTTCL